MTAALNPRDAVILSAARTPVGNFGGVYQKSDADMQVVNEGTLLDLTGTGGHPVLGAFVDDGKLDTHTATVDWGDGTGTQMVTQHPGSRNTSSGISGHQISDQTPITVPAVGDQSRGLAKGALALQKLLSHEAQLRHLGGAL